MHKEIRILLFFSILFAAIITLSTSTVTAQVSLGEHGDIAIVAGATLTNMSRTVSGSDVTYAPSADNGVLGAANIITDLNNNLNVLITTEATGLATQPGDITWDGNSASVTWATSTNLSLLARRSIHMSDSASAYSTGAGSILFTANTDGDVSEDFTAIRLEMANLAVANGAIALLGTGGTGPDDNHGIRITRSSTISAEDGSIDITGIGGGDGTNDDHHGVFISDGALIQSLGVGDSAAAISLDGTGGNGENRVYGIHLLKSSSLQTAPRITSVDGNISLVGKGGTVSGQNSIGIFIRTEASIESTGRGAVILDGTASTGAQSDVGVDLRGDSFIRTLDGDISVTGVGGETGLFDHGIYSEIRMQTMGAGSISLDGTGKSTSFTNGIQLNGAGVNAAEGNITMDGTAVGGIGIQFSSGSSAVTQRNGNITITANTTTDNQDAFSMRSSSLAMAITASDGNISITGTIGPDGDLGINIGATNPTIDVSVGSATMNGDITLQTDTIQLGNAKISSQGNLTIEPITDATTIGLGGGAGTLNLSDTDLLALQDGFSDILIGSATAGAMMVNTATVLDDLTLLTGSTISDANDIGVDLTNSGNTTTLNGELAPGSSPGTFSVVGDVAFADGSGYSAELSGTPNATTHDLLDVTGNVTIGTNVTLTVDTTDYTIGTGEIVLIANDAADSINGSFANLSNGDSVGGGLLGLVISYSGDTGNDVTLVAMVPTAVGLTGAALIGTPIVGWVILAAILASLLTLVIFRRRSVNL